MTRYDWIADRSRFDSLVNELRDADAYAIDTEFHRERTYLPVLGLVQVATPARVALVDPMAVDLAPLVQVFEGEGVCVMHAASQDLEILELACGAIPRRLFDTQVAALFCGYRVSSLGRLIEGFLGKRLDKSAQLTDWTRRPLPEADCAYAASDVAHLLELRSVLQDDLRRRRRLAWADEEIERLRSKDRSSPDPQTLWWRLRGKTKLTGRARGVAQELAIWREEEAKRRNRPPRSVLSDMALLALAQRPVRNASQLRGIRGLDASRLQRKEELLAAIARGRALPKDAVRVPPQKPNDLPRVDGVISLCLAWLAQRASEEDLDVAVLGTREEVTQLVLGQPSRLSVGWRRELVGRDLASIIDGAAALRVAGTKLELLHRNDS